MRRRSVLANRRRQPYRRHVVSTNHSCIGRQDSAVYSLSSVWLGAVPCLRQELRRHGVAQPQHQHAAVVQQVRARAGQLLHAQRRPRRQHHLPVGVRASPVACAARRRVLRSRLALKVPWNNSTPRRRAKTQDAAAHMCVCEHTRSSVAHCLVFFVHDIPPGARRIT